jgi:hypothetical protein
MEYVDVQKRGPPIRYGCPPHEDGEADVPSITTVYVVYMDERNNTIMEGSSAEYGGGLHYGNGTSGRLKRRQHGHLTIPSGSTYIFPGYFVEHSVAPLKKPGIIRSVYYCLRHLVEKSLLPPVCIVRWSFVVFWNMDANFNEMTMDKYLRREWWQMGANADEVYCDSCRKGFCSQKNYERHACITQNK